MATLAKIRGLPRGSAAGDAGVMRGRGLRVTSGLGLVFDGGVKAALTPTANSVTFTAVAGGVWGNSLRVATAVGTLAVSVAYNATTGFPTFTVTAPATATLAANQALVAFANGNPEFANYLVASVAGTGAAANAAVAAANLTGGTDVGTGRRLLVRTAANASVIVDLDDSAVAKVLRRSAGNYNVIGAGKYLDA